MSPPGASSSSEWGGGQQLWAHPPHAKSVSGVKNPQEVHAQSDETLLRIPLPVYKNNDFLGDRTWAAIMERANERHLKVSIRSVRNSVFRSGHAEELGVEQQIHIMKLNPGEPIPLAETLDFYEDIMDMFEAVGLKATYPSVEEERHDDTMGKVEVYMHGRLVKMIGSAISPLQVTAFTRLLADARARVERIYARPESFVFTRRHAQCVLRKNDVRARLRSRSRRRRSDDAPDSSWRWTPGAAHCMSSSRVGGCGVSKRVLGKYQLRSHN